MLRTGSRIPITGKTQFPLVQTMRGIAALWVVFYHAEAGGHLTTLTATIPVWLADIVFRHGHYGVAIFFALSGFVIAHSLRDLPMSAGTLGKFALRRSIRLDLPYWASIVVVLAIGFLSSQVKNESFSFPTVGNILSHMLYLQIVLTQPVINTVYWTLTYEIQFYIFYAGMLTLAAGLASRWPGMAKFVWLVMATLAIASALKCFTFVREGVFLSLWAAFFAGVLAYKAVDWRSARWVGLLLGITILLTHDSFLLFSGATALFLFFSTVTGSAQTPPLAPFGQWLGKISYSLYLIHNPITGAVGFISRKFMNNSVTANCLTLVMIIAVCLFSSYVFWKVCELPAQRLSRLVKLQRGTSGSTDVS